MANKQINSKALKDDDLCRNIEGDVFPGLCLNSLTYGEAEDDSKETECAGNLLSKTRYGVHQTVSGDATMKKSWYQKGFCFSVSDFISLKIDELNTHYLKIMTGTDANPAAKADDKFYVSSVEISKSSKEDVTLSFELMRRPDFQP